MNNKTTITITDLDAMRLETILSSSFDSKGKHLADLERELERAIIVPSEKVCPNTVTMNSVVAFRILPSGKKFCLQLVYPDKTAENDTLSVFAPVGSALIGLTKGEKIRWTKPNGSKMEIIVDEVVYQPEREGAYSL
ncbi:nucleoside diphosphate kinase regulator [Pseudodesulfovibrio portus]|uniref:Nucleoside diphosphate kinase regulator n=1 Tax=Pseudodesulfovibrio portus TaxID=231439 RepID=A0ABM8ATG0_9BACT|nr:nucleoside diphosphate kinase regulator [Pseudodesulfovibrio portus]BDQ34738.1 nucleoside diphosphate kinase regulator [Pseudodesulfovibrio portus]